MHPCPKKPNGLRDTVVRHQAFHAGNAGLFPASDLIEFLDERVGPGKIIRQLVRRAARRQPAGLMDHYLLSP
jgi:hypothetical protein